MRFSTALMTVMVFTISSLTQTAQAEGFYKWKDARGVIQYGDNPPPNVKATNMKMPKITVIENYGNQWKTQQAYKEPRIDSEESSPQQPAAIDGSYTRLEFIAPKSNQVLSGGFKGSVSAMLSIKPALKKGHKVTFSLDGKEVAKSTSRINNFSNLGGGRHTVSASIVDANDAVIMTSRPISFKVVRKHSSKKRKAALEALLQKQKNQ